MKPDRIILVRHGLSIGNKDKLVYKDVPDYAIQLTAEGHLQARNVGEALRMFIDEPVRFYVSPFWRTRQTFAEIAKAFPNHTMREDPRLREQEWGHLREFEVIKKIKVQRDAFGSYYFRFPDGESGADVEDRITTFLDTLHRDFEKQNFPRSAIIVSHGFTIRVFLKRWFHWTTEQFEKLANPKNCQYFILKLHEHSKSCFQQGEHGFIDATCGLEGKYELEVAPEEYEKVRHPWQFSPSSPASQESTAPQSKNTV